MDVDHDCVMSKNEIRFDEFRAACMSLKFSDHDIEELIPKAKCITDECRQEKQRILREYRSDAQKIHTRWLLGR